MLIKQNSGDIMNILFSENIDTKAELRVVGLFHDEKPDDKELVKELGEAIERETFVWGFGKTYSTKTSKYKQVLIISLGKVVELDAERVRRVMSQIIKVMKDKRIKSATTDILSKIKGLANINYRALGRASAEGLFLSDYTFEKYLSKKKDFTDLTITIQFSKDKDFSKGFAEGKILATNTNYARDMVNEPAIVVTPRYLEAEAEKLAKTKKVKVTVLNRKEMEQKGLGCILAVSKGSDQDPKLIILEYNNNPKGEKIGIVGKGITFDAGGYDIKPAGKFADMKCDMSGAAAVLATIKTAVELDLRVNIVGAIPSCENLINGSAMKPGDIITAYNDKTIEITNTDAEGRLLLADAISYTEKNYTPNVIVDLATLTGACIVALGRVASGMVSNDKKLSDELIESGNESYDRVWAFPFYQEYQEYMDGDITDLRNTAVGSKDHEAGSITGGVFLSKFVDKAKWAHIDIAGPAFVDESFEYNPKHATGTGVRLLTYYLFKKNQ